MLKTPAKHLQRYYPGGIPWAPEWQKTESAKYAPIWQRAFDIHQSAHYFGEGREFTPYTINPVEEEATAASPYCDCYEQAYQEFEKAGKLKELGIE